MVDAVVPLIASDLARFRILERSMAAHLLPLRTCWVVVPDREYRELAGAIQGRRFVVVPESRIVPEMADFPRVSGWYRQQLIKLAMAEHVQTEYYLLLDADVICARPISKGDLLAGGKALCYRYRSSTHARWYRWAERVLGVRRSGWVHGVTPAVLSRHAVLELAQYLVQFRPQLCRWWHKLLPRRLRPLRNTIHPWPAKDISKDEEATANSSWRTFLLESLPWTEYSLYFTFLEAAGRFEHYHAHSDDSLCGRCVWRTASFADWDPVADQAERQRPFLVVQSNTGIPPEQVLARFEKLLAA